MPTKGTDRQTVRVDEDLWAEYGQACAAEGTDRSADLREHMRRKIRRWRRSTAPERAARED